MNGGAKFKSTWFVVTIPVGRTANDTLSPSAGADLLADLERVQAEASKPSTTDWEFCPRCGGSLDTGWECVKCGADWRWVK